MPRKRREIEEKGLDLVPVMNLVTILIPFLLMSAQFVSLAVIDSSLPAIVKEVQVEQEDDDKETLALSILVTGDGFTVSGKGTELVLSDEDPDLSKKVPCLEIGCPTPESYDYRGLTERCSALKDRFEDEGNVILVPESSIEYEVLVRTMDATRNDQEDKDENSKARVLFPNVVIAGGVN